MYIVQMDLVRECELCTFVGYSMYQPLFARKGMWPSRVNFNCSYLGNIKIPSNIVLKGGELFPLGLITK